MRQGLRRLLLLALHTDTQAQSTEGGWRTRCLHCRSALHFSSEGTLLDGGTLEHVVPKSWFETREAAPLTREVDGPDDARNLALACARCNQSKGRGPDAQGPGNPRAQAIVWELGASRLARWRPQAP
jgi:5-methylcytosine-specific restriction endonuclease McrA